MNTERSRVSMFANDKTECAGHGAFGAFGKDNNFAGGANGEQTGL